MVSSNQKNSKKPLVGIALLAYNYGKYVDDAIDSLKKQTFQDFEVFLLDDGSNDGYTPKKLESVQYDKISKKLLYKENIGNAERRKKQYKIMENKYIMDMSGDDAISPEFLEKTVKYLEEHPECGAVSTDMYYYRDTFDGEPFSTFHFDKNKMGLPEMLSECHCLGSALMRNDALKKTDLTGGFKRYQDWDRWISMLEAGWKIGLISEPLFSYRLHESSLSHSSSSKIENETFHKIIRKHDKLYSKYKEEIMEALFIKFQESGFFNKQLTRDYLKLEAENKELNKRVQEFESSTWRRISKKIKRFFK